MLYTIEDALYNRRYNTVVPCPDVIGHGVLSRTGRAKKRAEDPSVTSGALGKDGWG